MDTIVENRMKLYPDAYYRLTHSDPKKFIKIVLMIKMHWSALFIVFLMSCSNFNGQKNKIIYKNRSCRNNVEFELIIYNKSAYLYNTTLQSVHTMPQSLL